jgi:hypothetical protein
LHVWLHFKIMPSSFSPGFFADIVVPKIVLSSQNPKSVDLAW